MTTRLIRHREISFIALAIGVAGIGFSALPDGTGPTGGPSPTDVQKRLTEGNRRFAQGQATHPNCDAARRRETAEKGQHPVATILTCSDSRVSPERIFDQGVGDVFIVRVAGNVADTDEIGSIEYGVGHLHTPLLVVMGHSACGAVGAVVSGAPLDGCLPQLVDNIGPAVQQTRRANPGVGSEWLIAKAVDANVFQSIADVFMNSEEVRTRVQNGKLKIVGAVYDLGSGAVRWLGEHPEQAQLARGGKPSGWQPRTVVLGTTAEKPAPAGGTHGGGAKTGHASGHATGHTSGNGLPTPQAAFQMLRDGNGRFAAGNCTNPNSDRARIAETSKGQHPFATVLTCSDSRVPAERIFDAGLGDVFTVRVAGNVADTDEIGSIEYAVGHLETPVLAVLGHTACGAVTAVVNNAEVHGSIPPLVANIQPAVKKTLSASPGLSGGPLVAAAIRTNVQQSIEDVLARSPTVRKRVESGQLLIVGGVYDLAAGTIEWFSPAGEPWSDGGFSNSSSGSQGKTGSNDPKSTPSAAADPGHGEPAGQPGSMTPSDKPAETPKSDKPAEPGHATPSDKPAAEPKKDPSPSEPVHDEPTHGEPKETPSPEKPTTDKPAAEPGHGTTPEKPSTDKPSTDRPSPDKPGHDTPSTDKPARDKPGHGEPTKEKPGHGEPAKDKPDHP
ncbi:MAG: hypothetical protein IT450_11755 [Phycisphaerales bacterium]|nr:hypothetical protein [Phycisphaerales bacterium]